MLTDTDRKTFEERLSDVTSSIDVTVDLDTTVTIKRDGDDSGEAISGARTLPTTGATDTTGETGSRLQLIGTLGEGGMGVVHLARQVSLDREVAVKTPRQPDDSSAATGLLQEAWVTGRLEHPNVVPIYTLASTAGGAPQIVMKRIEGTPWSEVVGEGPPVDDPVWLTHHIDILMQVCSAVRFAHSRGVIHRDVKPQNVMIGDFDEVYLLDWGLAVTREETSEDDAHDDGQSLVGTPGFMAPEMVHGLASDVDERTDVYLLGATLHWLLTGECRHQGSPLFDVLYTAWKSESHDYGDEVPSELAGIANRACSREKSERYQTVDAFRRALDDYRLHHESIELSSEADERLQALLARLEEDESDEDEDPLVHDFFGECRFGFRQALRMWPGNVAARQGLQEVLETMTRYHISRENPGGAQACVAELPEARPDLAKAVDALAERRAGEAEELRRLKRLEENLDLGASTISRSWLALILGIIWTFTSLRTGWKEMTQEVPYEEMMKGHAISGVRNLVIVVVVAILFRKRVFVNRANRQLMYTLIAMVLSGALLRLGMWWFDAQISTARLADDILFGFTALMVGVITDRRIAYLSSVFYIGILLSLFWPHVQIWWSGVATFVFFFGLAWVWRRPS